MSKQFTMIKILVCLTVLCVSGSRSAADVGWVGQALPEGLKRSSTRNEYVHEKSGLIFVYVPAGPSRTKGSGGAFGPGTLQPQEVSVPAFYIAKYEVSVEDFEKFANATKYKTRAEEQGYAWLTDFPDWKKIPGIYWKSPGFMQTPKHPAVCMAWMDAQRYCEWAGLRLPTNDEWIKASHWDKAANTLRRFPWGGELPLDDSIKEYINWPDDYYDEVLHMNEGRNKPNLPPFVWHKDGWLYTAPVDAFPKGVSPYGAWNMSGNAEEWCADAKQNPPPNFPQKCRYVNGGSYRRAAMGPDPFLFLAEDEGHQDVGFRPAISGQ